MKAFVVVFVVMWMAVFDAMGQQNDVRRELEEISLANKRIQEQWESRSTKYEVRGTKTEVQGTKEPWYEERTMPDSVPIQQYVMAYYRDLYRQEYRPENLLRRVGDVNFIHFIQRGDFSVFILGTPRPVTPIRGAGIWK
ncbi:hypothetical protein KI659_14910 [Litoribacter alkaliphilus]|uniref:Uncharacterized protein n=1 Tax=Litoribacter ruber TaxID=702568 RepID=A0AAP2G270_9BACT|nr:MULTISPECIES: hypothetical protein [Litoribacter]MBS9525307.1 hypothetical protein [Litoribacter alkaliphilus]